MKTYLAQLQFILDNGKEHHDRTGVGTLSSFGLHARYDLRDGFPTVTTKQLVWKSLLSELLWFTSGSGNINDLKEIYPYNKLWDLNYRDYLERLGLQSNDGDMGRIYGTQWRRWRAPDGRDVDQLQNAVELIRNDPTSRRIIVSAWNPGEIGTNDVALPPCHSFFQFYVDGQHLSLQMYQRSADMFLGVPLNITSYSILLLMVAKITGLIPKEFVHVIGDAHIYLDAVDQCREQVTREPYPLPELEINDTGQREIDDFQFSDFVLKDYQCHQAIKANMAV